MSNSLYNQTIPILIKHLRNLSALLDKSAKHADAKGIEHDTLLGFRLYEDMRPLPFQVQSCSNTAKGLAVRVGGIEPIVLADDETTFAQLQTRIARTIEILQTVRPEAMDGKTDEPVTMVTGMGTLGFTGQSYVSTHAIPNFHFHFSTAYCILRHLGVPIGALDYLGADTYVKVE